MSYLYIYYYWMFTYKFNFIDSKLFQNEDYKRL